MSVVTSTICGRYSDKHCAEFLGELVHVFVGWLSINLGDLEFLEAVFDVLLDPHGGSNAFLLQ